VCECTFREKKNRKLAHSPYSRPTFWEPLPQCDPFINTTRNGTILGRRFGDGLRIGVVASKFLNLPTVLTLLNCSRKTFTVGIHGQVGQLQSCQVSIEKAYFAFDCKYVSWSLSLSKLWHPVSPNGSSRSPGCNLWRPAVRTGVLRQATVDKGWEVQIFVHR